MIAAAISVIEEKRERERKERERRGGEGRGRDNDNKDGSNGGPGGRGGRPHTLETKFLRTLAVVDVPVPDEDGDNGGNGGGNDGGSSGGNGNRSNSILSPLIGDVTKKTTRARTTSGYPRGRHRPSLRGRRIMGLCWGGGTMHRGVQICEGHQEVQ